jgi:hypothetical protein
MKYRLPITISLLVVVAGCQTQQLQRRAYDRPKTSQQQMLTDRHDCIQKSMGFAGAGGHVYGGGYQSYSASSPNRGAYMNCMAAKGYVENDAAGALEVPQNLLVRMHN